jgi:hypothetical protein
MGLKEFWTLMETEPAKSQCSNAGLFQSVKKQILLKTGIGKGGIGFSDDKADKCHKELEKFFNKKVLRDITEKENWIEIDDQIKKKLTIKNGDLEITLWKKECNFYTTLHGWQKAEGSIQPARLVYYWFHAYESDKCYASEIDSESKIKYLLDSDGKLMKLFLLKIYLKTNPRSNSQNKPILPSSMSRLGSQLNNGLILKTKSTFLL